MLLVCFDDVLNEEGKYDSTDKAIDNKSLCLYRGKTSSTQLVKITESLTEHIFQYEHWSAHNMSSDFNKSTQRTHQPLTKTGHFMMSFTHVKSVTGRFVKISKVIGRRLKPKDMRTSSCSHLSSIGGIAHAAKTAGHTNVKTTSKYYNKSTGYGNVKDKKKNEVPKKWTDKDVAGIIQHMVMNKTMENNA